MSTQPTNIRDLREFKQLSQDKVAAAAGITYSRFVRIEEGSGKTTPEEIAHVMAVLKTMEPGTRKLAGRPFKDAAKEAAVRAAREAGTSVAAAIGLNVSVPATKPKSAPAEKAPAKASPAKPKAEKATGTVVGASLAASLKKPRSRKAKTQS